MSAARDQDGIQAYKGHSQYMRGRKIRIDVPQPEIEQPELDLELKENETEEGSTPAGSEMEKQMIIIDGEALDYKTSITWECFPGNIEIFLNQNFFYQDQFFSK